MNRLLMMVAAVLVAVGAAHSEEKSMWQRFVDFFSPTPTVEGEGPLYDELRELDKNISKIEGKYSRERRPANKDRYKKELEDLQSKREALVARIEAGKDSVGSSSSADSVKVVACKPDTVFVRDTVVVHDTLYVMLAPKPESAPAASAASDVAASELEPTASATSDDATSEPVPTTPADSTAK